MKKRSEPASGAASCPHCSKCLSFFTYAREISGELGDVLQSLYCCKDYSRCARYYILEQTEDVDIPVDVYPNQEMRAHSIVQEAQNRYS
ncbi:MAG: hypothetical protein PQJ59_01335 [Spirochaetales bacterium]|nr:hypothetical protein [Spirochaetales bacterium]